jgi:hypothetical protein
VRQKKVPSDRGEQEGSLSAFAFAAEKGAEFRALFEQRRPAEKPRQLQSFDSVVPVAAVSSVGDEGSSKMKRKADSALAEEKGSGKKTNVEHVVSLLVPVQKQPRRVLAFELYVMDKSTVKRSAAWFTDLSDRERREYYELEVRREEIAEAQRGSLEQLLSRPPKAASPKGASPKGASPKGPRPEVPKAPARKSDAEHYKRANKRLSNGTPAAPPPPTPPPAAAAAPASTVGDLALRAYEEFTKDHSGYMDANNTFVLRSDEELKRMFSELPNEMTSVYFNRAYSKRTAK